MNEHGFVRSVHRQLSPDIFVWKINDTYAGGVPDAFYAGPARCLFVEYKYIKLPKRPTTLVRTGLSEQQKLWLNRMLNLGKPVAVVLGSNEGNIILTNSQWSNSLTADCFRQKAVSTKAVASWIEAICSEQSHDQEGFFRGC